MHASWNLLLARARDSEAATAVALAVSVVVFAPIAALSWRVEREALPFIIASGLLQLAYFALLARAYHRSQLSLVYPLARGLAPVLVLVLGVLALGADTSAPQAAGVALVAAGVLAVRGVRPGAAAGTAFGLLIAAVIASYTLVDKRGVAHASPIAYLELLMVLPALVYLAAVTAAKGAAAVRAELTLAAAVAGVASFGGYVLVLAALERASAASVAAVRETSIVIAAVLAAPLLGERVGAARIAGAGVVAVGVALLAR